MPRAPKQSRELAAIAAKVLDVQTSISKPPKKPASPPGRGPLSMPARLAAIRAEEERALIRQTMSILGSRKSPAKTRAARQNAKLAGRPLGAKDKKPRKRKTAPCPTLL